MNPKFAMQWLILTMLAIACVSSTSAAPTEKEMTQAVNGYFTNLFTRLSQAAAQQPTEDTFRKILRPLITDLPGFYDATLIDPDWTIRKVYFRRHFLAEGFSLKKIKAMDLFREEMSRNPAPQLSEPAHGGLTQPHLIVMRYPVMQAGKVTAILALMVRTEIFLQTVGLDSCHAYRITCLGQTAETKGALTIAHQTVRITLPTTEWVIDYE